VKITDPYAAVRSWYLQYLDREPDPAGMAGWTDHLRNGKAPEWVLAQMLSSDEYYQRAGGTPEGFVRAFFLDAIGQEPPPRELQEWARRAGTGDRQAVAQALIQRYPQALQPTAEPAERHYLGGARDAVNRLASELERLQEDAAAELTGQKERELYRRSDSLLGDLRRFQRSLKAGVKREQLYGDFTQMDRKLHDLLNDLRALGPNYRSVQRDVYRVSQADQQLHYALSFGDTTPERGREVVKRQTQALLAEIEELQRTSRYALEGTREGQPVAASLDRFAAAVQVFNRGVERGADRDRLRDDYAAVDKAWSQVLSRLNELPPREGYIHVRRRAQEVDAIHDRLMRQLGLEGSRSRIILPYPGPSR
jgi:hypothetical protein